MLLSTQCSFDTTLNCSSDLKNCLSRGENDLGHADFGGWLRSKPRRCRDEVVTPRNGDTNKGKSDKNALRVPKTDVYYKRYRVDPLEGTFKHYKNISQYMQLYREANTLCYKQKTLDELSALYSAALDINRCGHPQNKIIERSLRRLEARRQKELQCELSYPSPDVVPELMILPKIGLELCSEEQLMVHSDKVHSQSNIGYSLGQEACSKPWEIVGEKQDAPVETHSVPLYSNAVPPITSHSESGVPLMLLPSAPSIPHRLNQYDQINPPSPLAVASFMCNAYMSRNIVCPVHRVIHGRSVMINNQCEGSVMFGGGVDRHVKVTLPGIPKRRYNNQAKRLRALRESHPIIGVENNEQVVVPPDSKSVSPNPREMIHQDEDEDLSDTRLSNMLIANNDFSVSERINTVLSQKRKVVPSMQLPVTALLNYSPYNPDACINRPLRIRKSLISKGQKVRPLPRKVEDAPKQKRDIRQLNYEQEYEKYFNNVLESKGKNKQRNHFLNLTNKM